MYLDTRTGKIMSEAEFRQMCKTHIDTADWGDESVPTVAEVMLNTDFVVKIER